MLPAVLITSSHFKPFPPKSNICMQGYESSKGLHSAYCECGPLRGSTRVASSLLPNVRLGWKWLALKYTLVNDTVVKFCNIKIYIIKLLKTARSVSWRHGEFDHLKIKLSQVDIFYLCMPHWSNFQVFECLIT